MRVRLYIGVTVAVLFGCSHPQSAPAPAAAPAAASAACEGYDVDPTWLRRGPLFQPCDVDEQVTAIQRVPTGFHTPDCEAATATVVMVVDTAGVPEPRTVKAVQSTSAAFAKAAVNALRQWRYRPAVKGGKKVRQVAQQRFDYTCQQVPHGR